MNEAWRRSEQLDVELALAQAEVRRWSEDARRWNQEAQDVLAGLGAAIDRQFDRWGDAGPARRRAPPAQGLAGASRPAHSARTSSVGRPSGRQTMTYRL